MSRSIESALLLKYLHNLDLSLHAKALETRGKVASLLSRVPATFENYTDHSIQHSDEIIRRLSFLLFDPVTEECTLKLSAAEVYILCITAMLHDTGMVVSPQEKIDLLATEDWQAFTRQDSIKVLWDELSNEVSNLTSDDQYLRDLKTRYLIAEYFRRRHAGRAATTVMTLEHELAGFAFGNPALKRTIADICAGHGLSFNELDDHRKFPFQRELLDEKVNVRLLAILLRLGDLLDIRYDRACPLVFSASSPIPNFSKSHWTQYHRAEHFDVTPSRVEFRALCETQEEHRLLTDWFQWLERETAEAKRLLSSSTRHMNWAPPLVRLETPNPSVEITPSESATYRPVSWQFELDPDAVFERLIRDAYSTEMSFIGELLQNAADANRVALSDLYRAQAGVALEDCRDASLELRSQFPITIKIERMAAPSKLQPEAHQLVITISDQGIGMTESSIAKYLLQVGKSYYQSAAFQDKYRFVPTSRFGIGFLSVFQVSDHVTVNTRSRESGDSRLLTVTGPRSYLLFEISKKEAFGTTVEVRLNRAVSEDSLTGYVIKRAQMLEFPISLVTASGEALLDSFVGSDFEPNLPPPMEIPAGPTINYQATPIAGDGIRGHLVVAALTTSDGLTSWASSEIATAQDKFPLLEIPGLGSEVVCVNGLARLESSLTAPRYKPTHRVDVRTRTAIERVDFARERRYDPSTLLSPFWQALLDEHLLDPSRAFLGARDWLYKQSLMASYPAPEAYWRSMPGTVRIHDFADEQFVSLADIDEHNELTVLSYRPNIGTRERQPDLHRSDEARASVASAADTTLARTQNWAESYVLAMKEEAVRSTQRLIWAIDLEESSALTRRSLLERRHVVASQLLGPWELVTLSKVPLTNNVPEQRRYSSERVSVASIANFGQFAWKVDERVTGLINPILNADHDFTTALLSLREGKTNLSTFSAATTIRFIDEILSWNFTKIEALESFANEMFEEGLLTNKLAFSLGEGGMIEQGLHIYVTEA